MDEFKKLFMAYLRKTLGLDDAAVAALYEADGNSFKSDTLDLLLGKDTARVAAFKTNETARFDEGYKKAQKEVMTKLETDFKEKFKFQSDKKGLELIEDFFTSTSKDKSISDEQVKAHPLYIAAKSEVKTAVDAKDQEWKTKYEGRESEINNEKVLTYVSSEAMTELEKLNAMLPEDPEIKKNHLKIFNQAIASGKWDVKVNGDGTKKIFPLDTEGKERLRDQHGNEISFADVIKKTASGYWSFKAADDRSASDPNKKGAGAAAGAGDAKKWKFTKPKDDVEFQKMFSEIETRTDLDKKEKTLAKNDLVTLHRSADGSGK